MNRLVTTDDDSMFCYAASVHIPKGADVLIDTQAAITENKIIAVSHIETGKTLIRKLEVIGNKKYLTPLNHHYARTILNNNYSIIGVAITVYQNL